MSKKHRNKYLDTDKGVADTVVCGVAASSAGVELRPEKNKNVKKKKCKRGLKNWKC